MWNAHNGHVNYLMIRIMPILYLPYNIQHVRLAEMLSVWSFFPPGVCGEELVERINKRLTNEIIVFDQEI